ncbi:MAG: tetratricopeptide repeat protein [Acidobacteria bacterium]|nr:MAG: tetratricopeptide repeat protein [Acidobacteriota bacterium]REJ99141.1 MAG: tetratricopeptide repeat protein [Acidobacteriota bacterium]REK16138.1 MAG: tetratricopeptide repeat protein [Acidobacteriota bacterium]REK43819.1 MAG: tetratricopeptide repeat protein [Acidobacteriota bacterium]
MNQALKGRWAAFVALSLACSLFVLQPVSVLAQDEDQDPDRAEAIRLIDENKYLDALPILERIVLEYPRDAELWAHFGIAIISNSVVLSTPDERREEQERGIKALMRAKQLGTENERALDLLDQFEGADGNDNFVSDNPEVEKALREGEAFFGRGDYENAFKSYERAHKLDPKNYEAVLFMGDCYYAQKKYQEAEPWFAKAVALDPDREMAYRFWGDALLYQEKYDDAREKFIDAIVAQPYARMGWSALSRWAEAAEQDIGIYEVVPPGNDLGDPIEIKEELLSSDDGTVHWREYTKMRKKLAPASSAGGPLFSHDISAWKSVAEAFRKDLKAGKIKYPDASLVNLLRLVDQGLLEPYLLLVRPYDHYGDDYMLYRAANRDKIRTYIVRHVLLSDK